MDHPAYQISTQPHLHVCVGFAMKIKKKKKSNQFKSYYPVGIFCSYSFLTNTLTKCPKLNYILTHIFFPVCDLVKIVDESK